MRNHPQRKPAPNTDVRADDLKEQTDAALVVRIARWDQQALAEAYRRHSGGVLALARRVVGSSALAEEIVEEVVLRLWNKPERFDPGRGTLRAFLLADTHGRSVDVVRSESARTNREDRDGRVALVPEYDLQRELDDVIVAEQVRDALAGLNDGERDAIELAYFGGLSYREVAIRLGEPEGTVKSRIRTGLTRLRAGLVAAGIEVS